MVYWTFEKAQSCCHWAVPCLPGVLEKWLAFFLSHRSSPGGDAEAHQPGCRATRAPGACSIQAADSRRRPLNPDVVQLWGCRHIPRGILACACDTIPSRRGRCLRANQSRASFGKRDPVSKPRLEVRHIE